MFLSRKPIQERISSPKPSKTLLSEVRKWGKPILSAHRVLKSALERNLDSELCLKAYGENYKFLRYQNTEVLDHDTILNLCSGAIILSWLIGRAAGELPSSASLYDAEKWYEGTEETKSSLIKAIDIESHKAALSILNGVDFGPDFVEILPYVTEVFETSDEIINAFGQERKTKRRSGVFYTPSDISDYIVRTAVYLRINSETSPGPDIKFTCLDPACGSGCFLISMLYETAKSCQMKMGEEALSYVRNHLFGIDISPIALQSAAYCVVFNCMRQFASKGEPLKECLFNIGQNLAVYDSSELKGIHDLSTLFPSLTFGPDIIISNPPYSKKIKEWQNLQGRLFQESGIEKEITSSLYLDFVRLMVTISNPHSGVSGMVVPLSIAYNTKKEFADLRRFMLGSSGKWLLAHFDRTPDSLFGDDVKTRNSIVFFAHENSCPRSLYTTDLLRWSSRSRQSLFDRVKFVKLPKSLLNSIIPKVAGNFGVQLLSSILKNNKTPLDSTIHKLKKDSPLPERFIRNPSTAYNWLPFEMLTGSHLGASESMPHSQSKYHYWSASPTENLPAVFALLQSRITYWLWRVWGDGFHLTDKFIMNLPLSLSSIEKHEHTRLSDLGNTLWVGMRKNSVISKNAGKESISYPPFDNYEIIDSIDSIIVDNYNLPKETCEYLREYVENTIVAERNDEGFVNRYFRSITAKEKGDGINFKKD